MVVVVGMVAKLSICCSDQVYMMVPDMEVVCGRVFVPEPESSVGNTTTTTVLLAAVLAVLAVLTGSST